MLEGIQTACHNYYQDIPEHSLRAVARSAVFSFTASLIICNQSHQTAINFARPVMAASVGALASTINVLTAPFFMWMFGNKEYRVYQEVIKMLVDMTLAHNLINYGTAHKVNLFAPQLAAKLAKYYTFSLNVLKAIFSGPGMGAGLFNAAAAEQYKTYINDNLGIDIKNVTPSVYFTI